MNYIELLVLIRKVFIQREREWILAWALRAV